MKSIKKIIPSQKVNMGGIILDQALPNKNIENIDPFLLIHHLDKKYKGNQNQKDIGIGPHPHRGFSPITFVFKGAIHHRDSRGNNDIIYEGGTQWMNSGMGIIHSERPSQEIASEGGESEIIQFWVNTPAQYKMNPPQYLPLTAENTPLIFSEDKKIKIGVVSGNYQNTKGPLSGLSLLLILRIDAKENGKNMLKIPKEFNTLIYLLDGELNLNGQKAHKKDLVWFKNDGDEITLEASQNTRAILLSGKPLNEKVVSHGPFVMNSTTQIMEAIKDYEMGKMGVLIEDFD